MKCDGKVVRDRYAFFFFWIRSWGHIFLRGDRSQKSLNAMMEGQEK